MAFNATLQRLRRNTSGTAAAEMALVTPLLVTLMFGSFELGNFFLSEHIVIKAVRDGARYAARRTFSDYTCPSTASSDVIDKTTNLTRTGQIASGGTARLSSWGTTNSQGNPTVTVAVTCTAISGGNYSGIYKTMTNVPEVTVTAAVDYHSLFNMLGLTSSTLQLNAQSQATVAGQ